MTSPRTAPRGLLATYWWLILATLAVTLAAAAAAASTGSVTYTAHAQVVVLPQPTIGAPIQPQMATEREIAGSGAVATLAASHLPAGSSAGGLSVSVVLAANVLDIAYTAPTARDAYEGAVAFSNAYVAYRNAGQQSKLADMVTSPRLPASGSGTNLPLVLGVGAFAGLALGFGAAWAWDRASDRIRTAGDVVRLTGATVLAQLPRWSRKAGAIAPPGRAAEAAGFAATRLHALAGDRRKGVALVVTSPRRGGGTTTLAANVATVLAAQGCPVVLVGADLHAPRAHESFGVPASPGLLDVLDGTCTLDQAVRATSRPRLRVLPSGTPDGRDELLDLEQLRLTLAELAASAVVVVDAPPLLTFPPTLTLASHAQAVLLAADLRSGTRADIAAADALLGEGAAVAWVTTRPRRARLLRTRLARVPAHLHRHHARAPRLEALPVDVARDVVAEEPRFGTVVRTP